jgi:hypothetical protein
MSACANIAFASIGSRVAASKAPWRMPARSLMPNTFSKPRTSFSRSMHLRRSALRLASNVRT